MLCNHFTVHGLICARNTCSAWPVQYGTLTTLFVTHWTSAWVTSAIWHAHYILYYALDVCMSNQCNMACSLHFLLRTGHHLLHGWCIPAHYLQPDSQYTFNSRPYDAGCVEHTLARASWLMPVQRYVRSCQYAVHEVDGCVCMCAAVSTQFMQLMAVCVCAQLSVRSSCSWCRC